VDTLVDDLVEPLVDEAVGVVDQTVASRQGGHARG
jgi:hypothetical protein